MNPPQSQSDYTFLPTARYSAWLTAMARITASAPILLVRDVVAPANYFRDCAGFHGQQMYGQPPPFWKIRDKMWNAYFWVDDADALYAGMKAAGAQMDYGPCMQPYRVREFGIQDLDGHDIGFGQVLG